MPNRALQTAASGMNAQQVNIQVIANNIANINTAGYKRSKAEFQDLMYQDVSVKAVASDAMGANRIVHNKIRVGNGVQPASTEKIFKQGDLITTNNQFDMAIQGDGFFQLRRQDGTYAYTRDGSFKMNGDGQLVSASGYVLEPDTLLNDETVGLIVARDGSIESASANGDKVYLDQIQLARFMNPAGLQPIGDNMYVETDSSGQPIIGVPGTSGFGEIHQGYTEASNVEIVEEMIAMIEAQRAYEINSKTVKTVEEMMTLANNLKRA